MAEYLIILAFIISLLLNIYCVLFRRVLVADVERKLGYWQITYNVCSKNGGAVYLKEAGKYLIPTLFKGLMTSRRYAKIIKTLKKRGTLSCQMGEVTLEFGDVIEKPYF